MAQSQGLIIDGSPWGLGRSDRFINKTHQEIAAELDEIRREVIEDCAKALDKYGAVYDTKRGDSVYTADIIRSLLNPDHIFKSTSW